MTKPQEIAIVCSDLHLDDHAWSDRPDIAGDSQIAFQQIVDFACKKHLPIVAAGDLIDTKRNTAKPIGFVRRCMDQLYKAGVMFYFIQGQHELQEIPWLCEIHDWPTWLHDDVTARDVGGRMLSGIDWTPRDDVAGKISSITSDTEILVMHQVCEEFMGGITVSEMHFGMIPCAKLLIVGDYHDFKRLDTKGMDGQKMEVVSLGATHMRKIDEVPPHRFGVLFDDLSIKTVKLKNRPYMERTVLTEEDVDHLVETIGPEIDAEIATAVKAKVHELLRKPLLRVKYHVEIPDAYPRISAAVGRSAHLFTKELLPSRDDEVAADDEDTLSDVEDLAELGLVGCLPLACDEGEYPEVFALCNSLLTTDDPQAVLAEARAAHLDA